MNTKQFLIYPETVAAIQVMCILYWVIKQLHNILLFTVVWNILPGVIRWSGQSSNHDWDKTEQFEQKEALNLVNSVFSVTYVQETC